MKKAVINFDSRGSSGNIFCLLGSVGDALRKQRRIIDCNNCRERVLNSHSYEEALTIMREYVNLIDIRGKK